MNRREEEKAASARKSADAQFKVKKSETAAIPSEREMEREAVARKTARLRALRLAKEQGLAKEPAEAHDVSSDSLGVDQKEGHNVAPRG